MLVQCLAKSFPRGGHLEESVHSGFTNCLSASHILEDIAEMLLNGAKNDSFLVRWEVGVTSGARSRGRWEGWAERWDSTRCVITFLGARNLVVSFRNTQYWGS